MSRNDVKHFVKASSALRLKSEKFKKATKAINAQKQELRYQLKNLLPAKGSFRAADFVVTTLERCSYKGISEAMVRSCIVENFNTSDRTTAVLRSIASKRKGPKTKQVVVSAKNKTTTAAPVEVHGLLEEFGRVEKQMKQYKKEFDESVSELKSIINSYETRVSNFMSGGSDKRNISLALDNGMVEKWILKRQSTRMAITLDTLERALQQATGETVDDYADDVMHILDSNRKTTVKLIYPRIEHF